MNNTLNLPILSVSASETVDQGWQFSADLLAVSGVNLSQLTTITFNGDNFPFMGIPFAIDTAEYNEKTKILSLSGVDSATKVLNDDYSLPVLITEGEASTCSDVLAPLNFTGSAPSFPCFAPQGEGLKNIDVLRGYCTDFGGFWRSEGSSLRLFDKTGTGESLTISSYPNRILEAVLSRDFNAHVNPRLQCNRQSGSKITVENGADTVQVLKKLTNPNAPAEAVTPNAGGGVNVPELTPEEEQAANSKYPADIFIDPWTKTAQRIYVPLEMPYYKTAIKIEIAQTESFRCTFITAAAEGWQLHLFRINSPSQPQPGPSEEGTYIFDRIKKDIEIQQGSYYARIQRKIEVSSGLAIEFPHAPGISIDITPRYAVEAPFFVLNANNSDPNVFVSSAYYFLPDGTFASGQGIAEALKAKNEIDSETLKIQLLRPFSTDNYKNVRIGSIIAVSVAGTTYSGMCVQTNFSAEPGNVNFELVLSLTLNGI